jgi:predicted oxidoreductase
MAATKRAQFLLQLYHHAVLPRDVPGHDDGNISSIDSEILDRLIRAVQGIAPYLPDADKGPVDAVRLALTTAKTLNVDGQIDKRTLVNELQDLRGDNVLILYITEQNAALLVYRLPR